MYFSIIIPVYNRPDEIKELLDSIVLTDYKEDFEVVIIEDGSSLTCEKVIDLFKSKLNISYYNKENTGPGDSRNFGMKKAKGEYFLIFDSDCIIPKNYLSEVSKQLKQDFDPNNQKTAFQPDPKVRTNRNTIKAEHIIKHIPMRKTAKIITESINAKQDRDSGTMLDETNIL
jgi:glycosyltransferase involved in cell wall biosynthesis